MTGEVSRDGWTSSPTIDLPIEVIVDFMSYLSLSDRIYAGQVCRIWHEASSDVQFLNKEKVVLRNDLYRPMEVLENSNKRIMHLVLEEVELAGRNVEKFLDKFCPSLRSLVINNCDISAKGFTDILKRCCNLESLSVIGCRELFISGRILDSPDDIHELQNTLGKLKALNLDKNRYLTDSLFHRFMSIAPNIEELSLSGCQISYHSGLYKKFYPVKLTVNGYISPSESVLTFPYILSRLSSNSHNVKYLKFRGTLLDNSALSALAQLPKLRLSSLDAELCHQLSHPAIVALAEHQTSITHLNLNQCNRVVDLSIQSIVANMRRLTALNLHRCCAITNEGVAELHRLENLRELDLSYCENVTSEGIELGLCSRVNTTLRQLRLSALTLYEETVIKLALSLPRLESLELSYCVSAVTDTSIQMICQRLVWLQTLKLTACDKLTDAGLTGMGMADKINTQATRDENCPDNTDGQLRISLRSRAEQDIVDDAKRKMMVSQMCEDDYLRLNGSGYSLASLRGLQVLDLMGCNRITDVSLKYAIRFRELRDLNLDQCQQITHNGLSCLAEHNPSIETVSMSQCYNITDDVIDSVAASMHRLSSLNLMMCHQLTDASLLSLRRHCRSLRHLDVSHCHGMSLEMAESLEQAIPSLHTVNYTGLSQREQAPEPPKPPPKPLKQPRVFRLINRR